MSPIKNIIVVGATGNLGPAVIHSLISSGFTVSTLSRSSTTSTHPSVQTFQTDYTPSSLATAFKNQDAVVSTIGALGTLTQIALIDAAILAGVKRFIPSDFAPNSPDFGEMATLLPELHMRLKPKTVIIEYLIQKAAENPDFTWSAVGSGPLFDWTLRLGFLGTSPSTKTALIIDSGTEPYQTTTRAQIGRAVASILLKAEETKNQYLNITSFTTTQNEVLAACEKAMGEKFEVRKLGSEERLREGREMLERGDFRGVGAMWNFWCHRGGGGHVLGVGRLANGLLGLPREDLDEVVSGVVGELGG